MPSADAFVLPESAPESAGRAIRRRGRVVAHHLLPALACSIREISRETRFRARFGRRRPAAAERQHQVNIGGQLPGMQRNRQPSASSAALCAVTTSR
jgi:hypothetical protein